MLYLDSNAGAPLKPSVMEALRPLFSSASSLIPNPSSIHSHGRIAKKMLAEARERIAQSLGQTTDPEQLVFTSSGSEANQLAIRSVLEARLERGERPHWVTTPVEHDSNRQMIEWVESRGGKVSLLAVDPEGRPQIHGEGGIESVIRSEIRREMTPALISVMWVNNETGVISDLAALIEKARAYSIPVHVDAAQAWGKLPLDLATLGAQYVTFSAHKIGGLAGTGVLWLSQGHSAQAVILGKQEKGRRGGTENLIGGVAAGAAAKTLEPVAWANRVAPLRDRLQDLICERIAGTLVNGGQAPRVANTLNLNFEGVEGDGLVMAMDIAGYSVSSGSACSSGVLEPSHVLTAIGRSKLQAMAAVRISLADEIPWEQLEGFVDALDRAVQRVRDARKGVSDV